MELPVSLHWIHSPEATFNDGRVTESPRLSTSCAAISRTPQDITTCCATSAAKKPSVAVQKNKKDPPFGSCKGQAAELHEQRQIGATTTTSPDSTRPSVHPVTAKSPGARPVSSAQAADTRCLTEFPSVRVDHALKGRLSYKSSGIQLPIPTPPLLLRQTQRRNQNVFVCINFVNPLCPCAAILSLSLSYTRAYTQRERERLNRAVNQGRL